MRQIRLNVVLPAYASLKEDSTKTAENPQQNNYGAPSATENVPSSNDFAEFLKIANWAEAAKADGLFLADTAAGFLGGSLRRPWRGLDPVALLSAIAVNTENLGLVATYPANQGDPFQLARSIASLHQISKGRAAWNITTARPDPIQYQQEVPEANPYDYANEFVALVQQFWRSLPEEAIDRNNFGEHSLDFSKTAGVDFKGEFFERNGVLPIPGLYNGFSPVIFHAGASARSHTFAARWAQVYFTAVKSAAESKHLYAELKDQANKFGRKSSELLLMPGLSAVVGNTMAEAESLKAEQQLRRSELAMRSRLANRLGLEVDSIILDEVFDLELIANPVQNPLINSYREFFTQKVKGSKKTVRDLIGEFEPNSHAGLAGTPESIAEHIIAAVDSGVADGFNLRFGEGVADLSELSFTVFTELQNRGRFRTEYEIGNSYQQNLGV